MNEYPTISEEVLTEAEEDTYMGVRYWNTLYTFIPDANKDVTVFSFAEGKEFVARFGYSEH